MLSAPMSSRAFDAWRFLHQTPRRIPPAAGGAPPAATRPPPPAAVAKTNLLPLKTTTRWP
jgi:hypothetical protein